MEVRLKNEIISWVLAANPLGFFPASVIGNRVFLACCENCYFEALFLFIAALHA